MGGAFSRYLQLKTLAVAMCASALTLAPVASGDIALWVHGALHSGVELSPEDVARRIPPGYTLQEVDYPAGLWPWTGLFTETGAASIAAGVTALDAAIRAAVAQDQGNVLVIGESLGSMVVDQELRNLATQADRPDPAQVQFELIADPTRPGGMLSYHRDGSLILLTGTRAQPVAVTPYSVSVIKLQYDGIASFPDRPWHLLSILNALAGGVVYHGTDHYGLAAQAIMNGQIPPEDITTTTNAAGGVTTTYTIPQSPALLHVFEPIFPASVALLDTLLTPLINLGYSDLTPDAGPHLAPGGTLVNRNGDPVFGCGGRATAAATQPRPAAGAARTGRPQPRVATAARGTARAAAAGTARKAG